MTATAAPHPHDLTLGDATLDAAVDRGLRVDPQELVRWQLLWVSLVGAAWNTLAVVPVGDEAPALQVAHRLVAAAHTLGQSASCITASGFANGDSPFVHPLSSPLHSPAAALRARQMDKAVLVVCRGTDTLEQARTVRDFVGPGRFLGCLVVNRQTP